MGYCQATDLTGYVLQAYLDKVEELAVGSVQIHLDQVSAEIDEALAQGGYAVPEGGVSATLRRICAVMVCWRSIGQITSLMSTEAGSNNEWLPLQNLHSQARKDLDAIRAGKLDPFPEAPEEDLDTGGITVNAPDRMFGPGTWNKY